MHTFLQTLHIMNQNYGKLFSTCRILISDKLFFNKSRPDWWREVSILSPNSTIGCLPSKSNRIYSEVGIFKYLIFSSEFFILLVTIWVFKYFNLYKTCLSFMLLNKYWANSKTASQILKFKWTIIYWSKVLTERFLSMHTILTQGDRNV